MILWKLGNLAVTRQTAYPRNARSVVLEILYRFLMRLSRASGGECPKISTLAGLGILLTRVQTILAGFQLSKHVTSRQRQDLFPREPKLFEMHECRRDQTKWRAFPFRRRGEYCSVKFVLAAASSGRYPDFKHLAIESLGVGCRWTAKGCEQTADGRCAFATNSIRQIRHLSR